MTASTFGVGTPITYPTQFVPWGFSPYPLQGLSINPYTGQQLHGQPLVNPSNLSSIMAANPYGVQSLQQVLQLLQIVPQQLQQLEYLQQQQLQQLQQILQLIPVQLAQLQQLIQFVPQQIQQMQQPLGQVPGLGGFAVTPPWGIAPQMFGAQPGHVM